MPRLRLHPYRLPLRRPWVAASATLAERRGWLIELVADDGLVGWGDCAPLPSAGEAGEARCLAALKEIGDRPRFHEPQNRGLSPISPISEVRWAFETARFDIEARRRGVPLARFLGADDLSVPVNAALGPLDESCAVRAGDALARGFAIGKVKVGLAGIDAELARLRNIVDATGGRLRLRLDANRAWPAIDARRFLAALDGLPIDAIEEPLAAPTVAALAALQAESPCAIAVDESLPSLGADALIAAKAVRRLVLKPARIGGVLQTLTLAKRAQEAGMEVVITSVVDSVIGVAAAAHLAAAIAPKAAHGLATGDWLAEDVAPPLPIRDGHLHLPDAPGLGVAPLMLPG
ncbi:MAG: enolase C-terminal domain-like protein [Rhodocyclaceae bacterium]|nr:enolase C-terminal domain-like protein [Rhodocyclaceae bacterium]